MGSSSWSQSTTAYTNAPVTQENVTNPLNLSNSDNSKIGSSEFAQNFSISRGGNINLTSLDAGAIGEAFNFGSKLVQVVADMTRQNNAVQAAAVQQSTKEAAQEATDKKEAVAFDWKKYEIPAAAVGAVLVWWFVWGRKK